ncbi:hypothetical protein SteCoe_30273 [Stentor coeruleus]|uniref:Uncharacterized protein n=1 Tax=Stentor coeruleus TaxID=5963 RepID=A0A1R2B3W2_9CILI|nr:hypothetical protein SteCoe_30273 [Stentor coeruleus]
MSTDKNQTDSSQLTICVKDLYKPIQHHNYNRKELPSFRFKVLSSRNSSQAVSPLLEISNKVNNQKLVKSKPQGLMIQVLSGQNHQILPAKNYFAGIYNHNSKKRPSSGKIFQRAFTLNRESHENSRRNISCNIHVQKINISSYLFPKKDEKRFCLRNKNGKKIIPIPRVEFLTEWED